MIKLSTHHNNQPHPTVNMPVLPGATFFSQPNFQGDQQHFPIGTNLTLPSVTNGYKSVKVDNGAQVIAWQNHEHTGIFRAWTSPEPDISMTAPDLLTRFVVVDAGATPVSFVFKDETGGEQAAFSLKIENPGPARLTTVLSSNAPGEEQRLVGIIPAFAPPLNAYFEVSDARAGELIVAGPMAFQWERGWDPAVRELNLAFARGLPKQLRFEKTGWGSFVIRLVDRTRSEDYMLQG